jgi:predicted O-methyltransferase YrrM
VKNVLETRGEFYCFSEIENVRETLLYNHKSIIINDLGAKSKVDKSPKRTVSDIAKTSLKPKKQAQLLFRIVNHFQPKTVIELGTSLGISTLYISKAVKTSQIITIEGDKSIFEIAENLFKTLNIRNIKNINANFDNELEKIVNNLEKIDLVYFDGNHTKEATLKYFESILPKISENTVLIFDDIYWSKGMTEAWLEIKMNEKVKVTIDTFYFGIVLFRTTQPKQNFKLYTR